ncbi:unnamed protein product, partial [Cladocopium goreaui]
RPVLGHQDTPWHQGLVLRAVPWRHKALARKLLQQSDEALEDGNFPQVEQNCQAVLRLAAGWQPPRSLLAASGASGAVPADLVELGCPLSIEALRRRLLGRLLLGAEDVALEDAKRLKETRRWRPLAELAEAVALLQLGRAEEVKDVKDEMPGELGLAWRRVASARAQRSQRGHADVAGIYFEEQQRCPETEDDPELAKSCWYLATVLPPVPNYVHPNLEVVVFPNGQRGVQVTDDVPRGTLLMAATALVFQGPTALPVERSTETRLGLRGTPEQMVKVFKDPTAPMQKALSTALSCGSEVMAMKLSQLSDGEKQPEVTGRVLQELCEPFQSGRLPMKSDFTAQELFGVLKTNGFSCDGKGWGLWLTISFVNHSCAPTAHYVITQKEELREDVNRRLGFLMGFDTLYAVMTQL